MTVRERLLQEIEQMSDDLLAQLLDITLLIKNQHSERQVLRNIMQDMIFE